MARHLPDAGPGLVYGYRVHGPHAPGEGLRFDPSKLLLDPYARRLRGRVAPEALLRDGAACRFGAETAPHVAKAVVTPADPPYPGHDAAP
jgi:pullulanase/glycogen debranching enzyme